MMKRIITYCLVIICTMSTAIAQEQIQNNIVETTAENLNAEVDLNELFEADWYYKNHPLNINKATPQELANLYFLSPVEIQAIIDYRSKFGYFLEINELQSVDGISAEKAKLLSRYVSTGSEIVLQQLSLNKLIHNSNNELIIRQQRVLENKEGYVIKAGESAPRYAGSPDALLLRYRYNYGNLVKLGFNADKDAGEQFFKGNNQKGFDYYSAYANVRNIGMVKNAIIGDYQLQFGQGLLINSGLSFGKSPNIEFVKKNAFGIKPHNTANEFAFFRGVASTFAYKNINATLFASKQSADARVNADTLGQNTLGTIYSTGLHRSTSEIAFANTINRFTTGANIDYSYKNIKLGGTTYLLQITDKQTNTIQSTYKAIGLDYSYHYKNLILFGEGGSSFGNDFSVMSGVIAALDAKMSATIVYRHYDANSNFILGNAFGENSRNANENGLYIGTKYTFDKRHELSSYFDIFQQPQPGYLASSPTIGYDALVQYTYIPAKNLKVYLRGKYKLQQKDYPNNTTKTDYLNNTNFYAFRLNADYSPTKTITLRSRLEANWYKYENMEYSRGYYLAQDLDYNPKQGKFAYSLRFALFDVPRYDNRIYAYETDILYAYNSTLFYHTGTRMYAVVKYKINPHFELYAKYSSFVYRNLKEIGTGNETIIGNVRNEYKIQLRYSF